MFSPYVKSKRLALGPVLGLAVVLVSGCGGSSKPGGGGVTVSHFAVANLVANSSTVTGPGGAPVSVDPNLLIAWGVAYTPSGPFWVNANGTAKSTVYSGTGAVQGLVVSIPAGISGAAATPTGMVANSSSGFRVGGAPATFLMATGNGTIVGWNGAAGARVMVDNSLLAAANYTGLAINPFSATPVLYAANFASGKIEMYDAGFNLMTSAGAFVDSSIPAGFAPFNIQYIAGKLYVMYAKQAPGGANDVPGAGNGAVDVFDLSGALVQRLVMGGGVGGTVTQISSPWGVAIAPSSFGKLGGDVLVGNNGDGTISAFNPTTGAFVAQLTDSTGAVISIQGLWALSFRNVGAAGTPDKLYFTGENGGSGGVFGSISAL